MEWNIWNRRRIDNQHFVKNAVLQYSNWNGMEYGVQKIRNCIFHFGMEWNGIFWEERGFTVVETHAGCVVSVHVLYIHPKLVANSGCGYGCSACHIAFAVLLLATR